MQQWTVNNAFPSFPSEVNNERPAPEQRLHGQLVARNRKRLLTSLSLLCAVFIKKLLYVWSVLRAGWLFWRGLCCQTIRAACRDDTVIKPATARVVWQTLTALLSPTTTVLWQLLFYAPPCVGGGRLISHNSEQWRTSLIFQYGSYYACDYLLPLRRVCKHCTNEVYAQNEKGRSRPTLIPYWLLFSYLGITNSISSVSE